MRNTKDHEASDAVGDVNGSLPDAADAGTAGVTRRDFVGGTLIGAGAALLSMASPGAAKKGGLHKPFNHP